MWRARSVVVELQVWPERDERPAGVAAPSRNWPGTARPLPSLGIAPRSGDLAVDHGPAKMIESGIGQRAVGEVGADQGSVASRRLQSFHPATAPAQTGDPGLDSG